MTPTPNERQRRGRKIAMTPAEIDTFLTHERTCRVATVGGDGAPHVVPLWFVWDGTALWLSSIVKSQRWTDLTRDPRVGVVIDAGAGYMDLRGVELNGRVEIVGEVPRTNIAEASVAEAEQLFGSKYSDGSFVPDGRHAWMRVVPEKIVSWDFQKLADL